jgi:hypothetical protein
MCSRRRIIVVSLFRWCGFSHVVSRFSMDSDSIYSRTISNTRTYTQGLPQATLGPPAYGGERKHVTLSLSFSGSRGDGSPLIDGQATGPRLHWTMIPDWTLDYSPYPRSLYSTSEDRSQVRTCMSYRHTVDQSRGSGHQLGGMRPSAGILPEQTGVGGDVCQGKCCV